MAVLLWLLAAVRDEFYRKKRTSGRGVRFAIFSTLQKIDRMSFPNKINVAALLVVVVAAHSLIPLTIFFNITSKK